MASSEVVISQLEFQASKTWSAQKRQQEVINVLEQYDSAVDLFDLYANSRAPEYRQFLGTFDGFDIAFDNNPGDNVAHFAHLGGMLFGYLLIRYWNKNSNNFY